MFRNLALLLILTSAVALTGCASNASSQQMTYKINSTERLKNTKLANNISISSVSGGHETNPLLASSINDENFEIALKDSLKEAHLYQKLNDGTYQLNAHLVKLDKPLIGINLKVTCQVHYTLKDKTKNNVIYNKDITSDYTATMSDSPIAITRMKIANEGAARNNIKAFILDLYRL